MSDEKIVYPAATDHGSVLKPDQLAVIWDAHEDFALHMPNVDENTGIEEPATALIACMVRLSNEPEFMDEMLEWFAEQATEE